MKNKMFNRMLSVLVLISIFSCSEMEKEWEPELVTYPEFQFDDFSPKTGRPGTAITFTGSNFGEYQEAAKVYFNEVLAEDFVEYSDTEFTVLVPSGAGSGPVDVQVWTHRKDSVGSFEFIPPAVIRSVQPTEGVLVGDVITIRGENFGTDADQVQITFAGVEAEIVSFSETEIQVTVPETTSGLMMVTVEEQEIEGPYFLIGEVKLTGEIIGHEGSWGGNPDTEIHAALDGDLSTFVDGPSSSGFVGYDLGEGNLAQPTRARFAPRASHPQRIVGGQIRGSNDPSFQQFTILHTIEEAIPVGQYTEVELNTDQQFRYIYYYSPNGNTNIAEVEFYGMPSEGTVDPGDGETDPYEGTEGRYVFEFEDAEDLDWMPAQDASYSVSDGKLIVEFNDSQFEGDNKRRADLQYTMNGSLGGEPQEDWIYTSQFPILAIKFNKPESGNFFPDIRGAGSFGSNSYETDFVEEDVYFWDLSENFSEDRMELDLMQFKIADITSDETGYEVEWIRTFLSREELSDFLQE